MADIVDKSLDDIIKERHIRAGRRGGGVGQRGTGRGGFGQRRGAGRGGPRLNRSANGGASANGGGLRRSGGIQKRRSGGFAGSPGKAAAIGGDWNHDLYQGGGRRSAPGTSAGAATALVTTGPAKLVISNLDFGVSDSDIKGLFQEFGNIRKAAVHYDRSGRSLGTADVVFERRADGIKALRKYNGVSLDGRPMNIQLTAQLVAAEPAPVQRTQRSNNGGGFQPRRQNNGGGGGFQPRRGGASNGGGGRGGRGGRSQQQSKSAAELDAELETYTAKMQTDQISKAAKCS